MAFTGAFAADAAFGAADAGAAFGAVDAGAVGADLFGAGALADTVAPAGGFIGGVDALATGADVAAGTGADLFAAGSLADTAAPLAGGAEAGATAVGAVPFVSDLGAAAGTGAASSFGDLGGAASLAGDSGAPQTFGGSVGGVAPQSGTPPGLGQFSGMPASAVPASGSGAIESPGQALDQLSTSQDVLNVSGGGNDPLVGSVPPTSTASSGSMLPPAQTSPGANSFTPGPAAPTTTSPTTPSTFSGGTPGAGTGTPAPATPAPSTPPPAKAPGGGFDWKTAALLGLGAAPLALTLAKGESPLPPQATQLASTNTGLQNFANQELASVTNNQLTTAQAAAIAGQQQTLTNQWRQALFNQGVQNPESDTRWPQIQAQIQQQIQAQTQTMIQTNLQAALGASGQASSNLLNLANLQVQQDTAFTNAISGATKALGSVAAVSAIKAA